MIDIRTRTADLLGKTGFEPEQFWLGVFIFAVAAVSIGTAVSLGDILRFADEYQYMSIARNLVDLGVYSINGNTPTAYRPPSWPLLLAVGNLISYNVIWLRLINLVLHLGTSLLLLRFVRRLGLPFAAALITSAAYLFFPVLYFTATTFYPQTLCAFLIALMLNIMLACSVWATAVLGILTSVTALAAPGTALVLCLLVFLQTYHLPMRAMLLRLAVFGVAAALALTPWIARNYMAFAAFIPLSTSAGVNLLKGNSPGAGADTGPLEQYAVATQPRPPGKASRRRRNSLFSPAVAAASSSAWPNSTVIRLTATGGGIAVGHVVRPVPCTGMAARKSIAVKPRIVHHGRG